MKTQTVILFHTVASLLVSIHLPLPMIFLMLFANIKIDCIGHVVFLLLSLFNILKEQIALVELLFLGIIFSIISMFLSRSTIFLA